MLPFLLWLTKYAKECLLALLNKAELSKCCFMISTGISNYATDLLFCCTSLKDKKYCFITRTAISGRPREHNKGTVNSNMVFRLTHGGW